MSSVCAYPYLIFVLFFGADDSVRVTQPAVAQIKAGALAGEYNSARFDPSDVAKALQNYDSVNKKK